ncbi:MAG: VWA domain-containing protein [Brevinema sp.]
MNFESPNYLWLLLVIPIYILCRYTRLGKGIWQTTPFPFPWLSLIHNQQKDYFAIISIFLKDMLLLVLVAVLIIALARPRGGSTVVNQNNLGVDIILTLDLSHSMTYIDEPPSNVRQSSFFGISTLIDTNGDLKKQTRLEIAKRVIKNYIDKQDFNRIGLVNFVSFALTKAPLSTDKELLKTIIDEIDYLEDGTTAIGSGILTSLNRLKDSKAKSKVIILLTDGINNSGIVEPITAANVARELGIKIYTIGLGSIDGSWRPLENGAYAYNQGQEFDPDTLQEIADITGGKYFEASSETALQDVYNEIDSLEKSEIEVKKRVLYEEKFRPWLIAAMVLWSLWLILNVLIVKIP